MKPAAASAKSIFEITSTGSTTYKLTVAQNRCDDNLSFQGVQGTAAAKHLYFYLKFLGHPLTSKSIVVRDRYGFGFRFRFRHSVIIKVGPVAVQ